jgi:hypothetical protein
MWGAFSNERTGLSFTIAADPRQRSHSRVWVPWDSRLYCTVSVSRLPFLSPPDYFRVRVRGSLRLAVYRQSVRLGTEPRETHGQIFFSLLNTCGHSPYITSSPMRGWLCHLQLLLAFASTFILGSESRGTRDRILLSQIRDFSFCRLLRLTRLRWRYSTPPPHGYNYFIPNRFGYNISARTT